MNRKIRNNAMDRGSLGARLDHIKNHGRVWKISQPQIAISKRQNCLNTLHIGLEKVLEFKQNNSQTKNIRILLIGFTIILFRRRVQNSPGVGRVIFYGKATFKRLGETKIGNLDDILIRNKNIIGFQIPMNNGVGVKIANSFQNLGNKVWIQIQIRTV